MLTSDSVITCPAYGKGLTVTQETMISVLCLVGKDQSYSTWGSSIWQQYGSDRK